MTAVVLGQLPTKDNSSPVKNKAQPTGTTIPRSISNQDNSPLGPLPQNKTTHQDQNLYDEELSWWGVVRIWTVVHVCVQYSVNVVHLWPESTNEIATIIDNDRQVGLLLVSVLLLDLWQSLLFKIQKCTEQQNTPELHTNMHHKLCSVKLILQVHGYTITVAGAIIVSKKIFYNHFSKQNLE